MHLSSAPNRETPAGKIAKLFLASLRRVENQRRSRGGGR